MPDRPWAARLGERTETAARVEALVECHAADLERYLARHLHGTGLDCHDVLQDTWLKAWRALEDGARPREPRAWLFTIARNCAHDERRGHARRREQPLADEFAQSTPQPDELAVARETFTAGIRALQALHPRQRDAFVAHVVDGDSHAAIAHAQGTTVPAVKTLIHRARRQLRKDSAMTVLAPLFWLRRIAAPKTATGLIALAGTIATPAIFDGMPALALPKPPDMLPAELRTPAPLSPAGRLQHFVLAPVPSAVQPARASVTPRELDRQASDATRACASGDGIAAGTDPRAIRRALHGLSTDLLQYTLCQADLRDALQE